jgi:predicted DNA-binding transcriptional regulator YafY
MASKVEKEYIGLARSLRILRTIVESPYFYTKKRLADQYEVDESTITRDFEAFKNAGFDVDFDERYRYALSAEKKYDNLKSLLVFSSKEEEILTTALQKLGINNKAIANLQNKLSRIYDASKMHNTFDKNFLTKMDKLEKARTEKKVVILKDYPSTNSNTVSHRTVEAFHISAEEDIIHAFDLDKKAIRHFRISRTTKVELTPHPWSCEGHHNIVATDPFRIQDNNQVKVHLRLKVGAYNEILERFPLTRGYLKASPEGGEGLYDLECKVNHKLYGLSNFVLGYYGDIVSIIEPESLIEYVQDAARRILKE